MSRGAEDWVAPTPHGMASWCCLCQQDLRLAESSRAGQTILLVLLTLLQLSAETQECLAHFLQLLSTGGTAALHVAVELLLQLQQLLLQIVRLLQTSGCAAQPVINDHTSCRGLSCCHAWHCRLIMSRFQQLCCVTLLPAHSLCGSILQALGKAHCSW
jgi:hypothetical protein